MKKHVLLWLCLMLACFMTGGYYIVASIHQVTDKLGNAASLHQVETLRQALEFDIQTIQTDLLLQGSPHAMGAAPLQALVETTRNSAYHCLSCHHENTIRRKLSDFGDSLARYAKLLDESLALQAGDERLEQARTLAFAQGERLLQEVRSLSIASADRIAERVSKIHADIGMTKNFLLSCLVLGPLAIIIITSFLLRRFTGSINTLVTAAHALEAGNLDYRIKTPLKDEFLTLANAFNGMVASLQGEQQKFQSISKLYRTLFETAGDAIMITDLESEPAGRIISANRAASTLYGYANPELLEMNILDLAPDNKDVQVRQFMEATATEGWVRTRVKRKKKDGQLVPIDISIGLLEMDERRYLLSFCKDISDRLQAEEELQRANQMALVGQMAAGLAHEIKNPLAGIKVSLDVLADELELDPEDQELFIRVINEIKRMEKLLKSLLSYARPPQPQFDLVGLNRLIDSALKQARLTANGKAGGLIRFETHFADPLPEIEADSEQLQQVLLNLLLNAVDALESEGTITVTTGLEDETGIRIELSDTGKGMSEEVLEKLFSPFFTTKSKGTGLGLAICKRLIEQHGGTIAVRSQEGIGTSFVMTLPFRQQFQE